MIINILSSSIFTGKHGNQGLVSAFVIEWIPDLYPITGTGKAVVCYFILASLALTNRLLIRNVGLC